MATRPRLSRRSRCRNQKLSIDERPGEETLRAIFLLTSDELLDCLSQLAPKSRCEPMLL